MTIKVRGEGAAYRVVFEFRYEGAATRPGSSGRGVVVGINKVVEAIYRPGEGFYLDNGTWLGEVFPLFIRGQTVSLGVVWARPGEHYALSNVSETRAERYSVTIVDPAKRVVLEVNGSGVARMASLEGLGNISVLAGYVRRLESLEGLAGCRGAVAVAHYASRGLAEFMADIDYATGIPVLLTVDGAARYRPGGEYVRNGVKMVEMPASTLAVLLGLRSVVVSLELRGAVVTGG